MGNSRLPTSHRGPFHLTITSAGFAPQSSSGILQSGESYTVPQIALALATAVTEVRVVVSRTEVAEDQIKVQEKQRVLGVVPNFYVSYATMPFPSPRSKSSSLPGRPLWIRSAWESPGLSREFSRRKTISVDMDRARKVYAKRLGAAYGDFGLQARTAGGAILPYAPEARSALFLQRQRQ